MTPEQRQRFNAYRRQRYAALKKRGKCVSCGVAFAQGGVRCRVCALVILESVEKVRAKILAQRDAARAERDALAEMIAELRRQQ